MISEHKEKFNKLLKPVARKLGGMGVKPNHLTILGLALGLLGSATLFADYWAGVNVIVLAFLADGLDGLLAREQGKETKLGAYLDSVIDKVVEVATIGSFVVRSFAVPAGVFSPALSIIISYSKHRSGKQGIKTFFDRAERLVFFLLIMLVYPFVPNTTNTLMSFFNLLCLVSLSQVAAQKVKELRSKTIIEKIKSKLKP